MRRENISEYVTGGLVFSGMMLFPVLMAVVVIRGGVWASMNLLPWFSVASRVTLALVVFVFLPLAVPRTTRSYSCVALLISSFVFGITLWLEGFLLTLSIWGVVGVVVGLFIAGVGVVPVAMLATSVEGMWGLLCELVLLTIATFGTRALALTLDET